MRRLTLHLLTTALMAPAFFFGCTSESPQTGGTEQVASPSAPSVPSGSPRTNRPPIVRSAKIVPVPVLLNGSAMVQVEAEDPDGDPVAIRRQWLVNGNPIEGETGPSLVPRMLKRGDWCEEIPRGRKERKARRARRSAPSRRSVEIQRCTRRKMPAP